MKSWNVASEVKAKHKAILMAFKWDYLNVRHLSLLQAIHLYWILTIEVNAIKPINIDVSKGSQNVTFSEWQLLMSWPSRGARLKRVVIV